MLLDCTKLKELVEAALPGASVTIEDTTGTNDHFQMTVVSDEFQEKSLVERQRFVFQALGSAMSEVHALSLKTVTPSEITR